MAPSEVSIIHRHHNAATAAEALNDSFADQFNSESCLSISPLTSNLLTTSQEKAQLNQLASFLRVNRKRAAAGMMPDKLGTLSTLDLAHQALKQVNTSPVSLACHAFKQTSPVKKVRIVEPEKLKPSALHEACQLGPKLTLERVEEILRQDPAAVTRGIRLQATRKVYNHVTCCLEDKVVRERFQYPVNLAIFYKVSTPVLQRLIQAEPKVLAANDNNTCSLHILLRYRKDDVITADTVMLMAPGTVHWRDQNHNSALHIATQNGAPLSTIRHLVTIDPDARMQRNFDGNTPLDLAQRHSISCPLEVSDYLTVQTILEMEA